MPRRFTFAVLFAAALAGSNVSCSHNRPATAPASPAAPPQASPATAPPAASPAGAPAPRPNGLPDRLDDREFWRLVTSLSEPNGYFRSDNLLSNELGLQTVIPDLLKVAQPGRVYMGVGPEQNFTYIAALKPAMVFIVDVRRGNLDLQLLYKALFELSADRADFVSRLFSRAKPAGIERTATARDIFAAFIGTQADEALFAENLRLVEEHLTKTHGFALGDDDLEGIKYVYGNYAQYGPSLTYWMSGRGFGRNAPTYADLMVATDDTGVSRSFLASEENFAVLKQLESRNLLVPVVGNFAGPKALHDVGAYIAAHEGVVSAFYLSNVEQYLQMDGYWMDFCRNVRSLPLDGSSTFIRSVRSGQFNYGVGLTQQLGNMLADTDVCAGPSTAGVAGFSPARHEQP